LHNDANLQKNSLFATLLFSFYSLCILLHIYLNNHKRLPSLCDSPNFFVTFAIDNHTIPLSMDTPHIIIIPLLMVGSMLLAAATIAIFVPRSATALIAMVAMLVCNASHAASFETKTFIFWAIAAVIAIAIDFMLPKQVAKSRVGVPFISGGAVVGMTLGMLLNTMAGIITGAAVGALLGAIAFANTPAGHPMQFPSSKFFNYFAAKGLHAIVTMSIVGAILIQIIS
jgi:uncharacterized protein YqgC (DUF456 family)